MFTIPSSSIKPSTGCTENCGAVSVRKNDTVLAFSESNSLFFESATLHLTVYKHKAISVRVLSENRKVAEPCNLPQITNS